MKYQVFWKQAAEDDLAAIWLAADDRELITRAARAIDERLELGGPTAGESRPDGKRILLVAPLGVKFQFYPDEHTVRVADVWRFRAPRR